ncbi:MAG: hypothetical protein NUW23_11060 [Firmicutes bacterium]|jgi:hypothetical protein|nr:hypothetical protein [Bacillota bacterium]
MAKRIAALASIVAMVIVLSGCSLQRPWNEAAETALVLQAVGDWIEAVEAYDVNGMCGDGVLAGGFILTIEEGGLTYSKDKTKLRGEVESDAINQQMFRDDGGYEMRLDFDHPVTPVAPDAWDTRENANGLTIAFVPRTKATVVAKFEVYERADSVPGDRWWAHGNPSDRGKITIELVPMSTGWKMSAMNIQFGSTIYASGLGSGGAKGFGLGRLSP